MNTMVVVIMYGSNIVDDYNDYDGCIVFFVLFDFIRFVVLLTNGDVGCNEYNS